MRQAVIKGLFCAVAATLLLTGCAVGNNQVRDLSTERLARTIVENQTTQSEVLNRLGEPDYMTTEANGMTVMHYSWTRGRPSAKNFIPFNPIAEYPMTQKTLRVWCDQTGVVRQQDFSGIFYIHRMPIIGADSTHSIRPLTDKELNDLADIEG